MTWTKISEKLPDDYTHLLIKWQSQSSEFEFVTTGYFDGEHWQSTSTELVVTTDLLPIEWDELESLP